MLHLLENGTRLFAVEGNFFEDYFQRNSIVKQERTKCKIETLHVPVAAIANTLSARELCYMGIDSIQTEEGLIAVIEVRGTTQLYTDDYCYGTEFICKQFAIADGNVAVIAIVFLVDSPGGELAGARQLAKAVKSTKKPVVGYGRRTVASAVFWAFSQCNECYIEDELTGVGSIGTMCIFRDISKRLEAEGSNYVILRSDGSPDKNPLNGVESFDGEPQKLALAKEQELLTTARVQFLNDVRANRPMISANISGKLFYGKEAVSNHLVDGILDMEGAMKRAFVLGKLARK
ncbi:MAG: S49 family peptidase [Sediminibacterium sp.]|jgi:ClpP class serine protease|nr:S49 family peptidase [Sediminibacterium sp.]